MVWGLGVTQGHRKHSYLMSAYDFLFDFNRNYMSILYRFRVIARFLSKVANFNPPHLHLSPPYGVIPFEFCRELWCQKTIVWHYLRDSTFSRFDSIPECDRHTHTDRQTDGLTDTRPRHIPRLAQRCAVKITYKSVNSTSPLLENSV